MPYQYRTVCKVSTSQVDAGTAVSVTLPDGPGYYRLLRLAQVRTVGVAAATHQPRLIDGGAAVDVLGEGYRLAAAAAAANPGQFPDLTLTGEPGRYLYAPAGTIQWLTGANVIGDTWGLSLVVELVRQ